MRLKIIAGNLVAVLLLGLVSYVIVGSQLKQDLATSALNQIANDQVLVDRSLRLNAAELVAQVGDRADTAEVRGVFAALDNSGRRNRAYEAAEHVSSWLGDPARGGRGAPDIVVVADETGKVLARNADRNRMYESQLASAVPAVRIAVATGKPQHDVWSKDDEGKLLEVAVAPVRDDRGAIVGVLAVGFDLSNGLAQSEGRRLGGRDVAFVTADKVYSASLGEGSAKQLRSYLAGEGKAHAEQALGGSTSPTWLTSLADHEFAGVFAPLPGAQSAKVAYAVLVDRDAHAQQVSDSTKIILVLTLVFALVVIGYGFMLGNSIVRPIEEIEEGVLAVINGNTDLRLDTANAELGGLAYRINQLLNVFTGVAESPDEDEQGRVSSPGGGGDWKGSEFNEGQAGAAGGSGAAEVIDDPGLAARLSAEPADAYYTRVYREYAQAKQEVGEAFSVPEARFTQRLQGNEQALTSKHGVKAVRFVVQKNGANVVLTPVLIR
jgi:HAMP domain-containing protein